MNFNGELKAIADNMGLAKLDVTEAKNILEELKAMKRSSVHDSYHSAYSKSVETKLIDLRNEFSDLSSQIGKNQALNLIKTKFDRYVGELFYGMSNGSINL